MAFEGVATVLQLSSGAYRRPRPVFCKGGKTNGSSAQLFVGESDISDIGGKSNKLLLKLKWESLVPIGYILWGGFSSDWDAYTFSLNIPSPSTKRIVLHVKHPEFHKHGRPRVSEPYTQPVQVENVTFENEKPIKSEEGSQALTTSKLEEAGECPSALKLKEPSGCDSNNLEDSTDGKNGLQVTSVALFPCTLLTQCTGNPQAKEDKPLQPWKYYLCSFNPSILPIEITRRKEAMEKHEDRLEREQKCHRLV
ncbi:hypothetical protein BKA83DRAFT_4131301 [Pisolithus microcarpus]|nr:hypothetical protein BKA83DRAFT_4131301 [Pisolithus microcarpus]